MPRVLPSLVLLSAVLLPGAVLAQATAPITAVTLFPGSATIVRTARVEAGASRLVVAGLPTQFSMQSLRVEGDAGIRIGQVAAQDAARTESANSAQAALEARIQALQDQAAALDVQAGAADIVKGFLERTAGAGGSEPARVPVDGRSLAATVAAISQAATEALGRKHEVVLRKREIEVKVEALQRDLARLQSQSRDQRTLTIQLAAERAGAVRIVYQADNAGWRPAYRAELDTNRATVALERLAQVAQKTGEDWTGVRLVLSTAQPRQSLVAPTPQPWLLGWQPPRPAGEGLAQRHMMAPAAAPAPALAMGKADFAPPTFQTDGASATEFELSAPVTLPADGREVVLPLAREALAARQRVQVSPRQSTVAMLMAEVDKPAGVWPGGNLQLLRDGAQVGVMGWTPDAGETWTLSFGRDDKVQVRLTPVQGDAASTGVFDRRNLRRIADRITVRSDHAQPVDLLVLEASPVSTSDEVKVRASFKPAPTTEAWQERRGVVAWSRALAPRESASVEVAYEIEFPKEGSVTGLR